MGQADGVFYAGELCDWPERDGISTVPRSKPFWERVRGRIGLLPPDASRFKRLFEHPAGLLRPLVRRQLLAEYEEVTAEVLRAVAGESGCATVIDSSHYPRRARHLRRIMGRDRVRLVYMARRPSSVARSFGRTDDKGLIRVNAYLLIVSGLAWLTYLTHPRASRVIVGYEQLTESPVAVGTAALGRPLEGVDPSRLTVPFVFIGNRFLKASTHVKVRTADTPPDLSTGERITDFFQWPLRTALKRAVSGNSSNRLGSTRRDGVSTHRGR